MSSTKTAVAQAEAHVLQGNARFELGDFDGALESYAAAVVLEPGLARAHYNRGVLLEKMGRDAEAVASYRRAIEADSGLARARVNLGNALRRMGDLAGARASYDEALEIDPCDTIALRNRAAIALELGDLEGARARYERLLGALGDAAARVQTLLDWGVALIDHGEAAESDSLFRRVLAIDPANVYALDNLGGIALEDGRLPEARDFFSHALAVSPDFASARYNLALLGLQAGDFARAWDDYESRLQVAAGTVGFSPGALPPLSLEGLSAARLVAVRKEQGIGDQILFSTLLPELAGRGVDAVVEVDARLVNAYRRSLPGLRFVSPDDGPAAFERCSHEIPIGSLARLFRRTPASFERQPERLLSPDAARVQATRRVLGASRAVGISWRSIQAGRRRRIGAGKSASLEAFGALREAGEILVDLQYGDVAEERRLFDARHPSARMQVPDLDLFNDLEGVLAALACCELVVTTSNVTAHLAGALGKATWLVYLEANPPFHYWVPRPDGRALWYPSVRIVTDPSWGSWESALEAVAGRARVLLA